MITRAHSGHEPTDVMIGSDANRSRAKWLRGAGGRPQPCGPGARGFTMVEMLVVLAILGLLAMLALPRIGSGKGAELRAAAHAMAADLRRLRDEAIRRDVTTALVPLAAGYALGSSGPTRALPAGIALTVESAPTRLLPDRGDLIDFFPDGSSTGGVLTLSRNGSIVRVLVRGVDGRVRLHGQE